jgi:glutathione S-transferase
MTLDPWNIFTANFGQIPKPYTALITLLDMVLYLLTVIRVGKARGQYKVDAPSTAGPDKFQRIFRIQQNTLEQLAFHLPILWIAAFAMSDVFAASFGAIWLFARILYAVRYYAKASRRSKGFIISMLANFILLIGALAGTIAAL